MILRLISHLRDFLKGKTPLGAIRSGKWPKVRSTHLATQPICQVCGGSKSLNVHHIQPFHINPDLELDPSNLITLCEDNSYFNCHRIFGHLNNFKGWNPDVVKDSIDWAGKLKDNEKRVKE